MRRTELKTYADIMPSRVSSFEDLIPYGFFDNKDYIKNFNTNKEYVEINTVQDSEVEGFKKDPWTYKIGKYNFRNTWDLQSSKKRIGFFGCSFTFGEGIKNEDTFVSIVSNNLNLNSFNFGSAGSGVERVARLFSAATSLIEFDYAVVTLPSWYRQLHVDKFGTMINLIPNWPHDGFKEMNKILTSLEDDYYVVRGSTSINWIYDIAKNKNIKLILSSWDHPQNEFCQLAFPDVTINPFPNIDDKCARDKMHPGPKSQQAHAEQIIKAFDDRAWV